MTDYIESMMRTAGVNLFLDCKRCGAKNFALALCTEVNCKATYPYFTPAKQLDIIKLISSLSKYNFEITSFKCEFYLGVRECNTNDKIWDSNPDFTQALAQLATELMKTGELDKEKVKEVLEC